MSFVKLVKFLVVLFCLSATSVLFSSSALAQVQALYPVASVYNGDGTFNNLTNAGRVLVDGNYAYVASSTTSTISVIDVSDPANPELALEMNPASGYPGTETVSEIFLDGNYLYVTAVEFDTLTIYDKTDPLSPHYLSQVSIQDPGFARMENPRSVFVQNGIAYVTALGSPYNSDGDALTIVDVSNPLHPSLLSVYTETWFRDPMYLYVAGDYAYIPLNHEQRTAILDIRNPSSPQFVTWILNEYYPSAPTHTYVQDDILYVVSRGNEMPAWGWVKQHSVLLYDVSDPAHPAKLSEIVNGHNGFNFISHPYGVWVEGNFLYVTGSQSGSITVVDVSDKTNPQLYALAQDDSRGGDFQRLANPNFVTVANGYVFATSYTEHALNIMSFAPPNAAPVVTVATPEITVNEGELAQNTGSVFDADGDMLSLTASVGAIALQSGNTWSWTFAANDGPTDSQTVQVTATDTAGAQHSMSFGVTVENVSPVVAVPQSAQLYATQTLQATGSFTDPGADSWTGTVQYGDGSPAEQLTIDAARQFVLHHQYTTAGSYPVVIAITDDDQGSGYATIVVTVITPAQGISALINMVEGLNLQKGISNSLDAKLQAALNALDDMNANNDGAAINALYAFINHTNAQRGGELSEAEADDLIIRAQAIIDVLNQP